MSCAVVKVPLMLHSSGDGENRFPTRPEPVTFGVSFARGVLADPEFVSLRDGASEPLPLQCRVTEAWRDGSVRWLLIDAQVDPSSDIHSLSLWIEKTAAPRPLPVKLSTIDDSLCVTIDTGVARFEIALGEGLPLRSAKLGSTEYLDVTSSALRFVSSSGEAANFEATSIQCEEQGPLRATVLIQGTFPSAVPQEPAKPEVLPVAGSLRLSAFANSSRLNAEFTVVNSNPAGHPGGIWMLGSQGGFSFSGLQVDLGLTAHSSGTHQAAASLEGEAQRVVEGSVEIYQESSGGTKWQSSNHVNKQGVVPFKHRGYRAQLGTKEYDGLRAKPTVSCAVGQERVSASFRHFWQNFPRTLALRIDPERSQPVLRLEPFAMAFPDDHELQGGEAKTHEFSIAFRQQDALGAWDSPPVRLCPTPEWSAESQALPGLVPSAADPNAGYQALVELALEGNDTFHHKREKIDQFGWRNFGEIYADHEAVFAKGTEPLISHYNNQYDAIRGFATQALRTGDPRWYDQMEELALHVLDIDLYHTDGDKSAYNRGLFWHTVHYVDAGGGTHRSYPKADGVHGGGPSSGHLYTSGLLLHYLLTGHERSRLAVEQLGQYVIEADDGRRTMFRWVDRGPTGHISESGFDQYHGPGRSPGNALGALVDAHRLTGESRFLVKAEELIRRTIHPNDDLESQNLLDAENRWYYTMYLQHLANYLEHKVELAQLDASYAYAQASLLHYANWAREKEYPYLDHPEILEYPTETWSAQDMRKAIVFQYAALHASRDQAAAFARKARFFFDESVSRLTVAPTRALARPVVLLLSHGHTQASFDALDLEAARRPQPLVTPTHWPPPVKFVSQKERVKRKLRLAALLGALGSLVAAAALFLQLLR